ncbi:MAG: hypothetical protein CYPHOPRED_005773 [Cyphobasidiales sp. Tagirdzhanova-0007]|nr:MAG: hypothetical protein CYPHOPRED_005773 [Cyphobasidiales sp. Tagirdzhanova-0007]
MIYVLDIPEACRCASSTSFATTQPSPLSQLATFEAWSLLAGPATPQRKSYIDSMAAKGYYQGPPQGQQGYYPPQGGPPQGQYGGQYGEGYGYQQPMMQGGGGGQPVYVQQQPQKAGMGAGGGCCTMRLLAVIGCALDIVRDGWPADPKREEGRGKALKRTIGDDID